MAAQNSNSENASASLSQRLSRMIVGGSLDYNSWRSLISEIEKASPEDINMISLAYDSFLSKFPLCNWHLDKYAYKKAKLCSSQEAVNIYERVVEVAKFSVGFWADYFTFSAACFGDPEDVRRLFGRAISFVGRDYFCHVLWDKYMKYEFKQEGWSYLAQSYIQLLRFPTKKLHFYYDNFKQFVANLEKEMAYDKNNGTREHTSIPSTAIDLSKDEISLVVKNMLGSSDRSFKSKALDKYRSIGEEFYQEACKIDEKVKHFEAKIQRRYFDAAPLDNDQLNNWHLYLDFIEKEDNMDWAMKLYERCLIPCATCPEFWVRYVEFLEANGGRELAVSALARATQNVSEIRLFDARFKEHIGDVNGARAALVLCDTKTDSSFIENVAIQANLERRLGNFAAASATYEKALKESRERRKLHLVPCLYSHFARLVFLMSGSASAARDVLIKGIQEVPHCRVLLEELINFAMTHEGATHVNIIDSIITNAISPGLDEYQGLNAKDRENISCLFLEFVDFCGKTHDIRKAWNRHIKLFPQRIRASYMNSRGNYSMDLAQDKKGNYVHSEPSKDSSFDHRLQLLEFPVNNELSPLTNAKETMLVPLTKGVVSSNNDESHGNEMDCETSCQSKEPRKNISGEIGIQSKDALSPDKVGKSAETTEPIEASNIDHRGPPPKEQAHDQSNGQQQNSDKATYYEHPMTPSNGMSVGQQPQAVSYPQQNTNTPVSDQQQPWQMNEMLQYHYQQQQQLLQQQYQQQLNTYFQTQQQYMNQQPYQQYQQQYFQQQQQHQSSTYQQTASFDQQGQTQYPQSQDLSYQAYQMAYQQQYQQYQQKQQDELVQQPHSHQHLIQNTGQNLKSSKTGTPDYEGAVKSSESPHVRVQSPQVLQ